MTIPSRTGFGLLLLLGAAPAALPGQAPGRWGCRVDSLSGYNCAYYYTGTVTLEAELRGANLRQTLRVVATVTAGRVSCRVSSSEDGDFEGPGMLVVEHKAGGVAGGEYAINVWCPESAEDRPRRGQSPLIMVPNLRAANYDTLEGRDAHEHPDADSANGLSGTETISWALRRS